MIMSPTKNNPIGSAPTQECGSSVSGRARLSRGAYPGLGIAPNQANPEEDHACGKLQAALLEAMDNLHRSIEQSMCILEVKIEKRTSAVSSEASHSQAGNAATEDLRQELFSLRDHVFRELDGMQFKVAGFTPQPIKTKTVATPPRTTYL